MTAGGRGRNMVSANTSHVWVTWPHHTIPGAPQFPRSTIFSFSLSLSLSPPPPPPPLSPKAAIPKIRVPRVVKVKSVPRALPKSNVLKNSQSYNFKKNFSIVRKIRSSSQSSQDKNSQSFIIWIPESEYDRSLGFLAENFQDRTIPSAQTTQRWDIFKVYGK